MIINIYKSSNSVLHFLIHIATSEDKIEHKITVLVNENYTSYDIIQRLNLLNYTGY